MAPFALDTLGWYTLLMKRIFGGTKGYWASAAGVSRHAYVQLRLELLKQGPGRDSMVTACSDQASCTPALKDIKQISTAWEPAVQSVAAASRQAKRPAVSALHQELAPHPAGCPPQSTRSHTVYLAALHTAGALGAVSASSEFAGRSRCLPLRELALRPQVHTQHSALTGGSTEQARAAPST